MASKMDFDVKLIDMVRANPLLYEKEVRSSPYDLMKRKNELWRSIASSLEVETKYCVIRWKNLRDKFRRELQRSIEMERKAGGAKSARGSTWHLMGKMSFLESHIRLHNSHSTKSPANNSRFTWTEMDAEQLIEQVINEDDPLQEAMEEQTTTVDTKTSDNAVNTPTPTTSFMKRIETLLEGLDAANRNKAEKRIVAYLCKCQLKSLDNENIDDIVI
ncbi:PREDICTED: transcription factor Adf-1 [Rhagoletis zephyria]|uniref:transcription factor Adf-1 n=1 Tax=Rhagoletis zephyria TaxID=28612 RepID=UPI000811632B|nr:PREDICTED: transcription factor Adf-1 [Rhagoletis zephyria]XP_017475587.1 PREDICTED: transcription factor Adf-1 [Rhagoletis zephyria]XP_017475589.1 PREDICTED: transcription factor Adf-1 [Rhagoletis zephyria]XP_017475590.1 PREDICTED: transcription factor Adf-1 [Rhagoletis zephyria]XP_017475591.1 PREDICTED: transcription factor Adf-1 [Rhagoletis zephyria]XP_036338143.1 transcription factor Adf-1 [Rhagoletis pomonella]